MPETPVDENYHSPPSEHHVGRAWEATKMESKPVSGCMKDPSDSELWLSVGRLYTAHIQAALLRGVNVHDLLTVPNGSIHRMLELPRMGEDGRSRLGSNVGSSTSLGVTTSGDTGTAN